MSREAVGGAAGRAVSSAASGGSGRWTVRLATAPVVYARLALASAFLSAVAARLGLWDDRPEPFAAFVAYTGEVLSFLPRPVIPACAVAATVAETALGVLLILGIRLRETAAASAGLLAMFGISMAISGGIKAPLDASVFSASAAAMLLSARPSGGARGGGSDKPEVACRPIEIGSRVSAMNAVARPLTPRLPSLRTLLVTDAVFELVVGAALLAPGSPAGRWLGSSDLATGLGAVFGVAAVGIALLARQPRPSASVARPLAVANVAGGVLLWVLVILAWTHLPPVARAASGAVADGCLLLGVLELLALRRAG